MRICPTCRAFYADPQLAFCLADGTPLANVDPKSERWQEGSRALEATAKRLSKVARHTRKLRWLRIVLIAVSALVLAVVMSRSFTVETTNPSQAVSPDRSPGPSPVASPSVLSSSLPSSSPSPSPSPSSSPASPSSSISPTPTPTPVYTISGTVTSSGQPLSGVEIRLTGAKTATMKTDANGRYAFSDLQAGGNYTVTPTRTQVIFAPTSRSLNSLAKDESADFSAEVFKISGRITKNNQPLSGVKVSLAGSKLTSTTTDGNGYYAFGDLRAGGSYKVTPGGQMGFSPLGRNFDNLRRDESADFTVETPAFKISGRVVETLVGPRGGVTVSIKGSKLTSTTTDGNGYYSFGDLRAGGSYTITPKGQMRFEPTSRYFDKLQRDESADFAIPDSTPTPPPTPTPSPTPTPTPTPACSDADMQSQGNALVRDSAAGWEQSIKGDRQRVINENAPPGIPESDATLNKPSFSFVFTKPCKSVRVTATYSWRVSWGDGRDSKTVPGKTTFRCDKLWKIWACRRER
jgi:cytoskeletal protein RodZ